MKEIEEYREEVNKLIEEYDLDLSNENLANSIVEIEKKMYDIFKKAQDKILKKTPKKTK